LRMDGPYTGQILDEMSRHQVLRGPDSTPRNQPAITWPSGLYAIF
jgi:hypothetical protein